MALPLDLTREELHEISFLAAMLAVSGGIWIVVFLREHRGTSVLPFARRRPAPWMGLEVLFIFLLAYLLPVLAAHAVAQIIGGANSDAASGHKMDTTHPAEQLLRDGTPIEIALVIIVAVVVAPAIEEFLFRVVLQGWLEALWTRQGWDRLTFARSGGAWTPIVLPAALFAMLHFRAGREPLAPKLLTALFVTQIVVDLVVLGAAIAILRLGARATVRDMGWRPRKLPADVRTALVALLAIAPPLLVFQLDLTYAFERHQISIAPDPIPLLFLALVFGVLYRRTHRIAPSLLLHMAFNATSIVLLLLAR